MTRARWIILVPVLLLLAVLAWKFWPRPQPFPYESPNDPVPHGEMRDAGTH